MEAGKKLILQHGYGKTKVEKITEEVGIAKGSFYNYFETKENFLLALISEGVEAKIKGFSKILEKTVTFEESVEQFVSYNFDKSKENIELDLVLYSLIRNIESLTSAIRELLITLDRKEREAIGEIFTKHSDELKIEEKEDLERYILITKDIIKGYKRNKFYVDTESEYFFSSSSKNVTQKIATLELEKEIKFLTKSIIRLVKGGK